VRDAAAHRLELDPGVLCSRERLEAIARKAPKSIAEVEEMPELRKWQVAELGAAAVKALGGVKSAPPAAKVEQSGSEGSVPGETSGRPVESRPATTPGATKNRSPYRDD
jgi:hypothetical protein